MAVGNGTMDVPVELPDNYMADTWTTIEVPISSLIGRGNLDITKVTAVVMFPTYNQQMGKNLSFQVGNVRFIGGGGGGFVAPQAAPPPPSINPPQWGSTAAVYDNGTVGALWDKGACAWDPVASNYCDGTGSGGNELITWSQVMDSDRPGGAGRVLQVDFERGGGIFNFEASSNGVNLREYIPNGNLKFDLKISQEALDAGMMYKTDCFYPCTTGDLTLDIPTNYMADDWESFEIPVADLDDEGSYNPAKTSGIAFFINTGTPAAASNVPYRFWISNVHFDGAPVAPTAGDLAPASGVSVYDNGMVGTLWDKGACAWDPAAGSEYCGLGSGMPDNRQVTWEEVSDADRPGGAGMVYEVTFSQGGGVFYFGADGNGVNLRSNYTESGKLKFDIKLTQEAVNAGMKFKLDCIYPCTTGDLVLNDPNLMLIDLDNYTPGTWASIEIPLSQMDDYGNYNGARTNAVVFFINQGASGEASFRISNVRFDGGATP